MPRRSRAKPPSPFKRFNSSPEVIRLVVLMYVRFSLSLRDVEDLLARVAGLLLRVIPCRAKKRHSVAMLTLTPCPDSI